MTNEIIIAWTLLTNAVQSDFKAHTEDGRLVTLPASQCHLLSFTSGPLDAGTWALEIRPKGQTNLQWLRLDATVSVTGSDSITNTQHVSLPREVLTWDEPGELGTHYTIRATHDFRRVKLPDLPPVPSIVVNPLTIPKQTWTEYGRGRGALPEQ